MPRISGQISPRIPASAPLSLRLPEEVYALDGDCVTGPAIGPEGREHVHSIACGADPYLADPTLRVTPFGDNAAPADTGQKLVGLLYSPSARLGGSLVAAYHGYKRNQSVGWALVWATLGGIAPPLTTVIALAQGYGQRK